MRTAAETSERKGGRFEERRASRRRLLIGSARMAGGVAMTAALGGAPGVLRGVAAQDDDVVSTTADAANTAAARGLARANSAAASAQAIVDERLASAVGPVAGAAVSGRDAGTFTPVSSADATAGLGAVTTSAAGVSAVALVPRDDEPHRGVKKVAPPVKKVAPPMARGGGRGRDRQRAAALPVVGAGPANVGGSRGASLLGLGAVAAAAAAWLTGGFRSADAESQG